MNNPLRALYVLRIFYVYGYESTSRDKYNVVTEKEMINNAFRRGKKGASRKRKRNKCIRIYKRGGMAVEKLNPMKKSIICHKYYYGNKNIHIISESYSCSFPFLYFCYHSLKEFSKCLMRETF